MKKQRMHAGLTGPAFFCTLVCSAAAVLFTYGSASYAQALKLPETQLAIGPHEIHVEVAATEQSRNYGLMNRVSLPPNHGMLFVFDATGQPCFWMKNTPLPLTIAFIDHNGIIVNLIDMQPHSQDSHCPTAPVMYALEMEQGWFQAKGIQAGQQLSNLPRQTP